MREITGTFEVQANNRFRVVLDDDLQQEPISLAPKLQTCLESTYVFDTDRHDSPDKNSSTTFRKGTGWRYWLDSLAEIIRARNGIVENEIWTEDEAKAKQPTWDTGERIRVQGRAVWELLGSVNLAVCGSHKPPVQHIREIKKASGGRCKVSFNWFNFESIAQTTPSWRAVKWMPLEIGERTSQLAVLKTDVPNKYVRGNEWQAGPTHVIDYYEGFRTGAYQFWYDPWAPPPYDIGDRAHPSRHLWLCDTKAQIPWHNMLKSRFGLSGGGKDPISYADAMVKTMHMLLANHEQDLDLMWWDQVYEHGPMRFGATNPIPGWYTSQRYREGWRELFEGLKGLGVAQGGNHGWKTDQYSQAQLPWRFSEHFFRDNTGNGPASWPLIKARLEEASVSGVHLVLGGVKDGRIRDEWYTTQNGPGVINGVDFGDWGRVRALVHELGMSSRLYVQVGRSELDGWLFHNQHLSPLLTLFP